MALGEDFARWREDPITRLVFRALATVEQAQKDEWMAASWGGGRVRADDLKDTLQELRVRADAYAALREMTIEDVTTWLGIDEANPLPGR